MQFHSQQIHLPLPMNEVQGILLEGKHISQIAGHADFFKPVAAVLKWQSINECSLEGTIPYLSHKHLCVFRIFATLQANDEGTQLTLQSAHGPWSPPLLRLTWFLGFALCGVGAVIPLLQTRSYSKQLTEVVNTQCSALLQYTLEEFS